MKDEIHGVALLSCLMAITIGAADVLMPSKPDKEHGTKVHQGTYTVYGRTETNVVTGDNARGCSMRNTSTEIAPGVFSQTLLYHPFHEGCTPYVPATEKWIATNIVSIQTYVMDDGQKFEFRPAGKNGEPRRWKLESDWKEVKP